MHNFMSHPLRSYLTSSVHGMGPGQGPCLVHAQLHITPLRASTMMNSWTNSYILVGHVYVMGLLLGHAKLHGTSSIMHNIMRPLFRYCTMSWGPTKRVHTQMGPLLCQAQLNGPLLGHAQFHGTS